MSVGHTHCPCAKSEEAHPQKSATIAASCPEDHELLKLDVALGKQRKAALALVDSGASHCFVSQAMAQRCGLHVESNNM